MVYNLYLQDKCKYSKYCLVILYLITRVTELRDN